MARVKQKTNIHIFFDKLPQKKRFTKERADEIASDVNERTVSHWLEILVRAGDICRTKKGIYRRIWKYDPFGQIKTTGSGLRGLKKRNKKKIKDSQKLVRQGMLFSKLPSIEEVGVKVKEPVDMQRERLRAEKNDPSDDLPEWVNEGENESPFDKYEREQKEKVAKNKPWYKRVWDFLILAN